MARSLKVNLLVDVLDHPEDASLPAQLQVVFSGLSEQHAWELVALLRPELDKVVRGYLGAALVGVEQISPARVH